MRTGKKAVQAQASYARTRSHLEAALGHLQAEGYERQEAVDLLLEIGARVLLLARPKGQSPKPPVSPLFPLEN